VEEGEQDDDDEEEEEEEEEEVQEVKLFVEVTRNTSMAQ